MINDKNKPLHLKKNELLGGIPIYHNVFSCENVYDADNPFGGLYTHDYIEVGMVVAGNGIHRVLDMDIPCKSGDIYITPPDIPHGYFLSDSTEVRVRAFLTRARFFICKKYFSNSRKVIELY